MFSRHILGMLLFLFAAFNSSLAEDFAPVCLPDLATSAQVDLNGDKKIDNIEIVLPQDEWLSDFELKVNDISVKDSLSYRVNGFVIRDIDQSDQYKEIAVYTEGPSSDDDYLIFWYDGKALKKMARVQRWPVFPGNGIVYVDDHMGFWTKREKYVLDEKTRELRIVPQEFYYVGQPAKVVEMFPIFKTRLSSDIVANLAENSDILILVCDLSPTDEAVEGDGYFNDWYLIKSSANLAGWARLKDFSDKVDGLPWAD
jgi:hypothetical protein